MNDASILKSDKEFYWKHDLAFIFMIITKFNSFKDLFLIRRQGEFIIINNTSLFNNREQPIKSFEMNQPANKKRPDLNEAIKNLLTPN